MLEDLDSKNGTFVGKHRLKPGEQRLMLAGTEIDLAQVRVVFDGISRPLSGAEGTGTIARRLVSDLFQGSPDVNAPTLTVIDGADNVTTLKLTERDKAYTVGRVEHLRPLLRGRGAVAQARFVHPRLSTASWSAISIRRTASRSTG